MLKTRTGGGPHGFWPYTQLGSAPDRAISNLALEAPGTRRGGATHEFDDPGQSCASLQKMDNVCPIAKFPDVTLVLNIRHKVKKHGYHRQAWVAYSPAYKRRTTYEGSMPQPTSSSAVPLSASRPKHLPTAGAFQGRVRVSAVHAWKEKVVVGKLSAEAVVFSNVVGCVVGLVPVSTMERATFDAAAFQQVPAGLAPEFTLEKSVVTRAVPPAVKPPTCTCQAGAFQVCERALSSVVRAMIGTCRRSSAPWLQRSNSDNFSPPNKPSADSVPGNGVSIHAADFVEGTDEDGFNASIHLTFHSPNQDSASLYPPPHPPFVFFFFLFPRVSSEHPKSAAEGCALLSSTACSALSRRVRFRFAAGRNSAWTPVNSSFHCSFSSLSFSTVWEQHHRLDKRHNSQARCPHSRETSHLSLSGAVERVPLVLLSLHPLSPWRVVLLHHILAVSLGPLGQYHNVGPLASVVAPAVSWRHQRSPVSSRRRPHLRPLPQLFWILLNLVTPAVRRVSEHTPEQLRVQLPGALQRLQHTPLVSPVLQLDTPAPSLFFVPKVQPPSFTGFAKSASFSSAPSAPAAPSGPSSFFGLQPLALRPSRSTQPCRPLERCLCQVAPLVLSSAASEDTLQSPASILCPPTALYVSSLFSSCGDVPPGMRRFPPRGFRRGSRNCAARAAQRPRTLRQNSSRAQETHRIVGPLATS